MCRQSLLSIFLASFFPLLGFGQVARDLAPSPDPDKPLMTLETSCGECNFGLPGDGCDVAVRLPGADGITRAYFVDGVGISAYGRPHDKNGFCVATRKAEVQGEVVDGRFKASYFKLLPPEKK